jgi:hypothetical protein
VDFSGKLFVRLGLAGLGDRHFDDEGFGVHW